MNTQFNCNLNAEFLQKTTAKKKYLTLWQLLHNQGKGKNKWKDVSVTRKKKLTKNDNNSELCDTEATATATTLYRYTTITMFNENKKKERRYVLSVLHIVHVMVKMVFGSTDSVTKQTDGRQFECFLNACDAWKFHLFTYALPLIQIARCDTCNIEEQIEGFSFVSNLKSSFLYGIWISDH